MKNVQECWMAFLFLFTLAACDVVREEGHVTVRLINADVSIATEYRFHFVRDTETHVETRSYDDWVNDTVTFTDMRPGGYLLSAEGLNAAGVLIQKGIAPAFEVLDNDLVETSLAFVNIENDACTDGENKCDDHNLGVVLSCVSGTHWEPVLACGENKQCIGANCIDDSSDTGADCNDGDGNEEFLVKVCDPQTAVFTTNISNPYFPLADRMGSVYVMAGEDENARIELEITVSPEPVFIANIATTMMLATERKGGALVQVSKSYFAQVEDGTVCYLGEDVEIWDDGDILTTLGSWRAGENGVLPGVIMPGVPQVGMTYQQEMAPGVAMDRGKVLSMGEFVTIGDNPTPYRNTLKVRETSPMDIDSSIKIYEKGIGLIVDDDLVLISISSNW